MDEFLSELKKLQTFEALTKEQVVECFRATGFLNRKKAEKGFKAALREVAGWKTAPLSSWAFNQVLGKSFPILETTWYDEYWIEQAQKQSITHQVQLVHIKNTEISKKILSQSTAASTATTGAAASTVVMNTVPDDNVSSWDEIFERNQEAGDACEAEDEADDNNEQSFRSDITDDAHPSRTAEYHIVTKEETIDHDSSPTEHDNWIVNNINISSQLSGARLSCLAIKCKRMSDVRLLMLNNVFFFNHDDPVNSVIKFLDVYDENDLDGANGLNVLKTLQQRHSYEAKKESVSEEATLWCHTVSQHAKDDWYKIQDTTVPLLVRASQSTDKYDLIIANILHQQALEFSGNKSKSTFEDSYVHRCVSSMFKTIFQSDPLFDYDWANGSLLGKRKSASASSVSKPDFVAFVASRRDVVVGEIKPPQNNTSTNTGESDLVKLGRMMRNMYNDLVKSGVFNPTIGGILVSGTEMRTFALQLEFYKQYELVQVSQSKVFHDCSTLTLLPTLVHNLLWLKNIVRPTAVSVLRNQAKKANGDTISSTSPPLTYLDMDERILTRSKKQKCVKL